MPNIFILNELPPKANLETINILKKLNLAHRALAELKGVASTIPNQEILINTLALQEAKDSSAIENIITTHDDLFRAELNLAGVKNLSAKEVQSYSYALKKGLELLKDSGILTVKHLLIIQEILVNNNAGLRKVAGTSLKNIATGETIYTPPQDYDSIVRLMSNLEKYINTDQIESLDVLIKMAIIHYQFESIHPFYDGNGRTGRILNILYLILKGLLDSPILYLSRYIIQNKSEYYSRLQKVTEKADWESYILFILDGIETTSKDAIKVIRSISALMEDYKTKMQKEFKFYTQDLLNNLFYHPYTKVDFLTQNLNISRITATNYLNQLVEKGYLEKVKYGKSNYYVNTKLFDILSN